MKFNQNQIKLFNRNINALNNTVLKENLKQIKSSKFKLILGKDNLYYISSSASFRSALLYLYICIVSIIGFNVFKI